MSLKLLIINPGSTSTKIALYEDDKEILVKNIEHSVEDIDKYDKVVDQFQMRMDGILSFLEENGLK